MKKAAALGALLALMLVCTAAGAWPWETLEVEGAMIWIGNVEGAPSPLLPALGLNLPLKVRRHTGFDASFLVTGTRYGYVGGRAIPVEIEYASQFGVLAVMGDARFSYFVPIGRKVRLAFGAGLLLFLRIPVPLDPAASEDFGPSLVYLLARTVYPETVFSVRFPIMPAFDLEIGARAGWPWFHFLDGEPYAFWDQLLVSGVLGFIYKLPAKKSK
jgi:hypothetical protein